MAEQQGDEMGQLIQPRVPQPFSDARDEPSVVTGPLRGRSVDPVNGANLYQAKTPSIHAHAILDEKHRSPRIDLDRQRHEGDQRSEDNQTDDRDQEANAAAGREVEARLSEVAGKD